MRRLGIGVEYITSLLRPVVDLLRVDAMAAVETKIWLQRLIDEKDSLINWLKDEVFRKIIEHRKLSARLEALGNGGETLAQASSPVKATSENSSLPPSKDPIGFKQTQSLRKKSGRSSGGQPGHKEYTKGQTPTPNSAVQCAPSVCPKCGKPISSEGMRVVERRQIWDIPLPIAPIVTEYQRMGCVCGCGCECRGEFPQEASAPVSYGPNVHTLVGYMSTLQCIPFKRMVDILNNLYGLQMSQGTVSNILQHMRKKA